MLVHVWMRRGFRELTFGQSDYNGPFILWAVDEPDVREDSEEEEVDEEGG